MQSAMTSLKAHPPVDCFTSTGWHHEQQPHVRLGICQKRLWGRAQSPQHQVNIGVHQVGFVVAATHTKRRAGGKSQRWPCGRRHIRVTADRQSLHAQTRSAAPPRRDVLQTAPDITGAWSDSVSVSDASSAPLPPAPLENDTAVTGASPAPLPPCPFAALLQLKHLKHLKYLKANVPRTFRSGRAVCTA